MIFAHSKMCALKSCYVKIIDTNNRLGFNHEILHIFQYFLLSLLLRKMWVALTTAKLQTFLCDLIKLHNENVYTENLPLWKNYMNMKASDSASPSRWMFHVSIPGFCTSYSAWVCQGPSNITPRGKKWGGLGLGELSKILGFPIIFLQRLELAI